MALAAVRWGSEERLIGTSLPMVGLWSRSWNQYWGSSLGLSVARAPLMGWREKMDARIEVN